MTIRRKKSDLVFFLDLQKGFPMTNKDTLLSKLFTYGIRGLTHQLLLSYLEKGKQYVSIEGTQSSTFPIGKGLSKCIITTFLSLTYIINFLA